MVVTTSTLATPPPCAAMLPPARRSVSLPPAVPVSSKTLFHDYLSSLCALNVGWIHGPPWLSIWHTNPKQGQLLAWPF